MSLLARRVTGALVLLALSAGSSACSNDSQVVVRPPTSTFPASAFPTSSSPSPTATPSASPRHPVAVVTPSKGLVDGQRVAVSGRGFSPGIGLVVLQCADLGSKTSSGDCNIGGLVSTRSAADGTVALQVVVHKGPFGANARVCSARQKCLISVTEASLSPSEEADAAISFR